VATTTAKGDAGEGAKGDAREASGVAQEEAAREGGRIEPSSSGYGNRIIIIVNEQVLWIIK
jgi:hypothetical protein